MPYNTQINRKETNSMKWDNLQKVFQLEDVEGILPMWVADMDIATPAFIIDALKQRLEHPVFGYSKTPDHLSQAIIDWYKNRFHWTFDAQSIIYHEGVIPAIASIIETFSQPGDKVCISTPVYVPFHTVPANLKRTVVAVPLDENDGIYTYNFEALEQAFQQGVRIYILCNPHNPAGVVWDEQTLNKILQLAKAYKVLIISDEIHADIVFQPAKHISLQTLEASQDVDIVTCIAPSKTFNLASLQLAMMVPSNQQLKSALKKNALQHGRFTPNEFAVVAAHAAYTKGAEWVDGLLVHLENNMQLVMTAFENSPLKIHKPQGTYLLWIDTRNLYLTEQHIQQHLLQVGKIGLDPGKKFGQGGEGFFRMNVATPEATIHDAIERVKKTLAILKKAED